jgi:predicted phage terminase large subunit-like protein
MYHSRSGFVFTARGIDSKVLGLKVGNLRPQLLICDDIEGDESTYSTDKVAKRLRTLQDAVLPLNEKAGVVITGTVTMAGSIIHQLVQAAHGDDTHTWITDERIVAHHHRPITQDNDGTERSTWPEKWPLAYLNTVRHTRSYAKNMDNRPMQADGEYWRPDHFRHTDDHPGASLTLLSVDPAVTGGTKADYTGLAVVQYRRTDGTMRVAASRTTRARGRQLRNLCIGLIEEYDVAVVLVETNQGGDLWTAPDGVFGGLGCKTITVHQTEPKTVRAERALKEYEAGRVVHAAGLADLETNMCAFPAVAHDDDVDAVVSAVVQLAARPRARRARAVQGSYG